MIEVNVLMTRCLGFGLGEGPAALTYSSGASGASATRRLPLPRGPFRPSQAPLPPHASAAFLSLHLPSVTAAAFGSVPDFPGK